VITIQPGTLIVPGTARANKALTVAVYGVTPLLADAGLDSVEFYAIRNTRGVVAMYTIDTRDFPEDAEAILLQAVPWAAKVGDPPSWVNFLNNRKSPNEGEPLADN
jgi:hypothetical protein